TCPRARWTRSPRRPAPVTHSVARSPPRTVPRPPCTWCRTGPRTSPASCCRSTAATWPGERMTPIPLLDRDRVRELFDLSGAFLPILGGGYRDDPYPIWQRLREEADVHPGIVHELTGFEGPAFFQGLPFPDRPHYTP